jgi:hypothetical protein
MFTYSRIQAGEYQINLDTKMVGYIKKQGSSKWIMYKATNPALLGKPMAVKKTLKELKAIADSILDVNYVPVEINENSVDLSDLIASVQSSPKMELMREMLETEDSKKFSVVDGQYEAVEYNFEEDTTQLEDLTVLDDLFAEEDMIVL